MCSVACLQIDAQCTKGALIKFADIARPDQPADQDLCSRLTKSVDTVVYVDEQRMLRSNCTDVHAYLDLRCPQIV